MSKRPNGGGSDQTHGHCSGNKKMSPTYISWNGMRTRCTNDTAPDFARYGGRGITYDQRWNKFQEFLADMGEKPEGTSLDRIDNDGPYCRENCRWATPLEQSNNKRNSRFLEVDGLKLTVAQWSRRTGIQTVTILGRLSRGWSETDAVTKPTERFTPADHARAMTLRKAGLSYRAIAQSIGCGETAAYRWSKASNPC